QLIEEIVTPTKTEPGREKREGYHYKRNGACVVLMAIEPLTGKRIVDVTMQKTKVDYSNFMKKVSATYPSAKKIVLLQDNLNTHNPSFYQNMPAQEAFELTNRFDMKYTPKRASWLNMAEIEFSALSKQCLDRRMGEFSKLKSEVIQWTKQRDDAKIKIHWQFTNAKAREKFKRHCDSITN
ncbi:MAG: transposase, partial [Oligoflexales bacterium]